MYYNYWHSSTFIWIKCNWSIFPFIFNFHECLGAHKEFIRDFLFQRGIKMRWDRDQIPLVPWLYRKDHKPTIKVEECDALDLFLLQRPSEPFLGYMLLWTPWTRKFYIIISMPLPVQLKKEALKLGRRPGAW